MKKFLTVLMALVLICSSMLLLVGCGGNGNSGGLSADNITLGSVTEKPEDYSVFSNEYVTFYYPTSWFYDSGYNGCSVVDRATGTGINAGLPYYGANAESADLFAEDRRMEDVEGAPEGGTVSEVTMIEENIYTFTLAYMGQTATNLLILSTDDDGKVVYYFEIGYSDRTDMQQLTTIINSIQFAN